MKWLVCLIDAILVMSCLIQQASAQACIATPPDIDKGYEILPGEFRFERAKEMCELYGGRLARIKSKDEQRVAFESILSTEEDARQAWFNLYVKKTGVSVYANGDRAALFENWDIDVNKTGYEVPMCANVGKNEEAPGLWNLDSCGNQMSALCQFPRLPTDYKYFIAETQDKINFENGNKLCQERGGKLAEFASISEYEPLHSTLKKYAKSYFVGYKKSGGKWKGLSGQPAKIKAFTVNSKNEGCGITKPLDYFITPLNCKTGFTYGAICKKMPKTKLKSGNEFYVVNSRGTFLQLNSYCSEDGGSVAKITNDEEQKRAIMALEAAPGYFKQYYLQSMRKGGGNSMTWADGSRVSYQKFVEGTNKLAANSHFCPMIVYNARQQGGWFVSDDCETKVSGILCSRRVGKKIAPIAQVGIVHGFSNKEYFVLTGNSLTYSDWRKKCKDMNGYLATIDTKADQDVMLDTTKHRTQHLLIGTRRSALDANTFINPGGQPLMYSKLSQGDDILKNECVKFDPSTGDWIKNYKCYSNAAVCEKVAGIDGEKFGGERASTEGVRKRYHVFEVKNKASYDTLKEKCKPNNGKIAMPKTAGEAEAARQAVDRALMPRALIGGKKIGSSYKWDDESSLTFEDFAKKGKNGKNCLEMLRHTGEWMGVKCSHLAVVCEYSRFGSGSSGTKVKKYEIKKSMLKKNADSWKGKCSKQMLATIRSQEEQRAVLNKAQKLKKKASLYKMIPLDAQRTTSDNSVNGFKWSDGSFIIDQNYKNWKSTTVKPTEKCVALELATGQWVAVSCSQKYRASICEERG